MDACVHRCRFVDWVPSPIVSIVAATRFHDLLFAVRESGSLETWALHRGAWSLLSSQHLGSDISSIAVFESGAVILLFSATLHGTITAHSLLFGSPLSDPGAATASFAMPVSNDAWSTVDSYGGAVWSISVSPDGRSLAAACEDGCVRIFDVSEFTNSHNARAGTAKQQGYIRLARTMEQQGSRMSCVQFSPSGTSVVSGTSKGVIHKWDVSNGRALWRMTTTQKHTAVRAIHVLNDEEETVVSGDAKGATCFWDGKHGTLLKAFQNHAADVLCIASAMDGQSVYAAGVDNAIVQFTHVLTPISTAAAGDSNSNSGKFPTVGIAGKWVYSHKRRPHTHDVRALAVVSLPQYGDLIVSGGVDAQICCTAAHTFHSRSRPIKVMPYPRFPTIQLAASALRLVSHDDHAIELWQLPKAWFQKPQPSAVTPQNEEPNSFGENAKKKLKKGSKQKREEVDQDVPMKAPSAPSSASTSAQAQFGKDKDQLAVLERPKCLVRLTTKESRVLCCAVDSASRVIAYSTIHGTRVMIVELDDQEDRVSVKELFLNGDSDSKLPSAIALNVSTSGSRIVIGAPNSCIYSFSVQEKQGTSEIALNAVFSEHADAHFALLSNATFSTSVPSANRGIKSAAEEDPLALSLKGCGNRIVRMTMNASGTRLASVDTNNRGFVFDLELNKALSELPRLEHRISGLSFHPGPAPVIALACASNHLFLFDFGQHRFTEWSRRNSENMPQLFLKQLDKVFDVSFHPAKPHLVFLHAVDYFCVVDTSKDFSFDLKGTAFWDEAWTRPDRPDRSARDPDMSSGEEAFNEIDRRASAKGKAVDAAVRLFRRFRPLLLFAFASDQNIVVVERSWLDVLAKMPETLYRHRYGT
eukprot:ANDGO_02102.mRNA.1 U3 small nucleolar RNA-associated protein 4